MILLAAVPALVIAALIVLPWVSSCTGKSLEIKAMGDKLRPLIQRYARETGNWPTSWEQLTNAYHPELDYEYELLCDNHFWRDWRTGSLRGVKLELADHTSTEALYLVHRPDHLYRVKIPVSR